MAEKQEQYILQHYFQIKHIFEQLDRTPYRILEFIENKTMNETFESMNYIFQDIFDNKNAGGHFKRLKVLNFSINVLKKLCRMQKIVQDLLRTEGIVRQLLDMSEKIIKEAEGNKPLKDQYQEDLNNFFKYLIGLLVNFVTTNKKNQKYCFERIVNSNELVKVFCTQNGLMYFFLVFIYNSLANQQKLRDKFIKDKSVQICTHSLV